MHAVGMQTWIHRTSLVVIMRWSKDHRCPLPPSSSVSAGAGLAPWDVLADEPGPALVGIAGIIVSADHVRSCSKCESGKHTCSIPVSSCSTACRKRKTSDRACSHQSVQLPSGARTVARQVSGCHVVVYRQPSRLPSWQRCRAWSFSCSRTSRPCCARWWPQRLSCRGPPASPAPGGAAQSRHSRCLCSPHRPQLHCHT